MKKTLFIAAAFGIFICASAFSPKSKSIRITTPVIEKSFLEEFGEHANVEWSREGSELVHASFIVGNQPSHAYFNNDGQFVCSTTEIQKENLPLKLRVAINKQFADASINAIILMNSPEDAAYFLQVTENTGTKVWKAYANGSIELFKKLK